MSKVLPREKRVSHKTGRGRPALLVLLRMEGEDWLRRAEEMRALCLSAGLELVAEITQLRRSPDPSTFVGKGKLEEIRCEVERIGADVVLVDREVTPAQLKHLQDSLPVEVLDRTGLILDVFARHAHSGEGKLQVELAALRYRLPRLVGRGVEFSRLGGRTGPRTAMGTRGAGEPWLVEQRRRLQRQIRTLADKIKQLARRRELSRKLRRKNRVPTVGIVGYTNSGKSTLLNALSVVRQAPFDLLTARARRGHHPEQRRRAASVIVEDRLFSTLDPTSRAVALPSRRKAVFSDTVGFIEKLPPGLATAFRATIEEATTADVLLHVVDLASPHWQAQRAAVLATLNELGCSDKPLVTAFNKVDLLNPPPPLDAISDPEEKAVLISAKQATGLDGLLLILDDAIDALSSPRPQTPASRLQPPGSGLET